MKAEPEAGAHTLAEILSQPDAWQATLDQLTQAPINELPDLRSYDHVIFVGCGSAYFLSRWAARHCQAVLGIYATAAPSSEVLLHPASCLRSDSRTLLVAVSRSAETTETVRAVEVYSRLTKGDSIAITCNPEQALGKATKWVVAAPHAKEQSVAQTRSFTSMMLLTAWLIEGKQLPASSYDLPPSARAMLERSAEFPAVLTGALAWETFSFLGSGPRYGLACEAMLKMKEMSLSHSEAYHFMEFRHGPNSMVNAEALVIGLASEVGFAREIRVLDEMHDLGAETLILAPPGLFQEKPDRHSLIILPGEMPAIWREPLYLPMLQLMAYHRSRAKGLDPDRPANLEAVVKLDE